MPLPPGPGAASRAAPSSRSPAAPRGPGRSARTSPRRCHSAPARPPRAVCTRHALATARLRSGSHGGDPSKRANGVPGDPLRENSPAAAPRPSPPAPSPPRGAAWGGGGPERASQRASERGDPGRPPLPAAQPTQPGGPGAPPARPPGPRPPRGAPGPVAPRPRGARRAMGEAAAAALTIAGRQALPGARVPMARTRGWDFTSIPFCPAPPFPGPPRLRLLPVFPRLPLAWPLRVSLSPLSSSFPSPRSSSSPPPPSLQRERKV